MRRRTLHALLMLVATAVVFPRPVEANTAANVSPFTVVHRTFTIAPGNSASFPIPAVGKPIRIDVSVNFTNGTTVSPTELMTALFEQNPTTGSVTFLGTNSDGSQVANNTISTTVMSSLLVPGQATPDAILIVTTPPPFRLGIYQYPQTTVSGTYSVTITY